MKRSPPSTNHTTADTPKSCGAPGLGFTTPHTPDRRTPKTVRLSPTTDKRRAEQVEPLPRFGGNILDAPQAREDDPHDDHLADEYPPPRSESGDGSADEWSGRDRDGSGGGDDPVGVGPTFPGEIPGHQGHDGRHDQTRPRVPPGPTSR